MKKSKNLPKPQPQTVSWDYKECQHLHLEKIAPMWYFCSDCGKIFNFILSLQYDYQKAINYLGDILTGVNGCQEKIKAAQENESKRESEAQSQAIEDFKKAQGVKGQSIN